MKRGFTVVELLVVVTVLAIVVALISTAVNNVNAKRASIMTEQEIQFKAREYLAEMYPISRLEMETKTKIVSPTPNEQGYYRVIVRFQKPNKDSEENVYLLVRRAPGTFEVPPEAVANWEY